MRPTKSLIRSAVVGAAAAALTATTLLAPSGAQAAPATGAVNTEAATALASQLGSRSAGTYLDQATGKLVVTVTDGTAAQAVRETGAVAKLVTRSGAELQKVTDGLLTSAKVAGTSWGVDPMTNQVVVSVDSSVTGAKLAQVKAATQAYGSAARLEFVPGTFSTRIAGGDAIFGGNARCSLGFNARSGSTDYFVTAGHCGNIAATWYANSAHTTVLGTRVTSSFPGNDFSVFRYTGTIARTGNVNLYNGTSRDITSSGNATVGQTVQRSGSTSGVHSGTVTQTNATVVYAEGAVSGTIRTNVCAEPGDSGGSLFAGGVALGMTSGGSGNCSSGGVTFFNPVGEALNAVGAAVF